MTSVTAEKARNEFSDVVNRAAFGKERTVITRRNKQLAVIVPIEDLKIIELIEKIENQLDYEAAVAGIAEAKEQGTVSWESIKAELGM